MPGCICLSPVHPRSRWSSPTRSNTSRLTNGCSGLSPARLCYFRCWCVWHCPSLEATHDYHHCFHSRTPPLSYGNSMAHSRNVLYSESTLKIMVGLIREVPLVVYSMRLSFICFSSTTIINLSHSSLRNFHHYLIIYRTRPMMTLRLYGECCIDFSLWEGYWWLEENYFDFRYLELIDAVILSYFFVKCSLSFVIYYANLLAHTH